MNKAVRRSSSVPKPTAELPSNTNTAAQPSTPPTRGLRARGIPSAGNDEPAELLRPGRQG